MNEWWRDRVVYQIYPRSFQDSNGDGVGDIPGIISRLDEIKDLGAGVIWLSPVYKSPSVDNGYDISDYYNIDPLFGTMADMERLFAEAEARDIKIIMDLVVNHTSDAHEWFQKSRDKDSEYRDYYIWREGKNGGPPNNWTGFFSEGAWEYDERSGEYYLHLFAKGQPDLNYRNPKVVEEVENIMRFWLDKGAAGFRCDVINVIWKSSFDNGRKQPALAGMEHYVMQDGVHDILKKLRQDVLAKYDCFTVGETALTSAAQGRDLTAPERGELDMVFSFDHMNADCFFVKYLNRKFKAARFAKAIARWQDTLEWNANYFENHDQGRSVSRFGDDNEYWEASAKLLCVMLLSLRGTPFIYQGEEIGMTNVRWNSLDEINDVESLNVYQLLTRWHFPESLRWRIIRRNTRDNARTPYQWDDGENAGFSSAAPWLKVNENYKKINLAAQKKDPFSVRNFYKDMIRTRSVSDTLKYGDFKLVKAKGGFVAYERSYEGHRALVLLNFSKRNRRVKYTGQLVLSSAGREDFDGVLLPYEAVILNLSGRM